MTDKELVGYCSGDTESQQTQLIFERPTGLWGIYSHPLTQVRLFYVV
jgi:hypothetical protein